MARYKQYNINECVQGVNGFGAQFADIRYSSTLGAGTEATVTVPGISAMGAANATKTNTKFLAVFSYHAARNVWVALNATAAVPAGATLAANVSELNPPAKVVTSGDVIHVICATANTDIGIAFYPLPEA